MTLRPKNPLEGSRPPALKLSLEEILKPFSGLSQVLGDKTTFKTLDDLNKMIQKATEEFEAMREDKLNDGRPLGPLQVAFLLFAFGLQPCHLDGRSGTSAQPRCLSRGCLGKGTVALHFSITVCFLALQLQL